MTSALTHRPVAVRDHLHALDVERREHARDVRNQRVVEHHDEHAVGRETEIDPLRLRAYGVTLPQVISTLQAANENVGGRRLTIGEQSYDVRGIGLVAGISDIENAVVAERKGWVPAGTMARP